MPHPKIRITKAKAFEHLNFFILIQGKNNKLLPTLTKIKFQKLRVLPNNRKAYTNSFYDTNR